MHGGSIGEGGDGAAEWPQPEGKSVVEDGVAEEKIAREQAEAATACRGE